MTQRLKNKNLQVRHLEPNDANRALIEQYNQLVKAINEMPGRLMGLHRNYRKREMPTAIARLTLERELKMSELLALEKILFPPQ